MGKLFIIGLVFVGLLKSTLADHCRWCGWRCCDENSRTCDCDDVENNGLSVGAIIGIACAAIFALTVVTSVCVGLCYYYGSRQRKPVRPGTNTLSTVAYSSNYPHPPPNYSQNSAYMPPPYSTDYPEKTVWNPPPYNQLNMNPPQPQPDNQLHQ
ncbi:uncharacterized protein LOC113475540 [Ciona intestinalis]